MGPAFWRGEEAMIAKSSPQHACVRALTCAYHYSDCSLPIPSHFCGICDPHWLTFLEEQLSVCVDTAGVAGVA